MKNKQEEINFDEFCKELTGHSYKELKKILKNRKLNYKISKSYKKKQFKPKVEEYWRTDGIITIKTNLTTTENPKGCFSNKEGIVNCAIEFPWGMRTSQSFYNMNNMIKYIEEELFLKCK